MGGVGEREVKGSGRKPCVPCCVAIGSFLALLEYNVRRVIMSMQVKCSGNRAH